MIFATEIVITLLLILAAKWFQDVLTTFDDDHELFTNDNPALGIAKSGYYFSVCVSLSGLFLGMGTGDWYEVRDFAIYGVLALVLINISTYTVAVFILRDFKVYDLICKNRNEAIGWSLFGAYLGSAFILRGALSGDDRPLEETILEIILYYALGQGLLLLASALFAITHKEHKEALSSENTAAGISFGGFLVAIGFLTGGMSQGTLHINVNDMLYFGISCLVAVGSQMILRYLFSWLFASGICLRKEIYEDRNRAAGWIVALGSVGMAQLILVAIMSYKMS